MYLQMIYRLQSVFILLIEQSCQVFSKMINGIVEFIGYTLNGYALRFSLMHSPCENSFFLLDMNI